jgi:hypothetical protein
MNNNSTITLEGIKMTLPTPKKICFEKSLYYFKKNKNTYAPCDCHNNTYLHFYDCNYEEVEKRENDFTYITGLMIYNNGDNKYCVVHSWVEDNEMIIDTTSLANSQLKSLSVFPKDYVKKIEELLNNKISYIPYFSLSHKQFNVKCQEFFIKSAYNEQEYIKAIERYLVSITQSIEKDKGFMLKIETTLGCEFKKDGFHMEIK